MIKTLHVSSSLSRAAGGIFEIELAIAQNLLSLGVGVRAVGISDAHWLKDAKRWEPVDARVCPSKGPSSFGYSSGLLKEMLKDSADCAHLHTMWMYPSVAMTSWSAKTEKPYVVTPNGMLEPWALSNSAWKKKLAGIAYENRMLRSAACIHANTEKELHDIRAYGLKNPIAIIPNGVELPELSSRQSDEDKTRNKILLFLGRIHPKKGLINALRAWRSIRSESSRNNEWKFVIAGWDQIGHEEALKQLCAELDLEFSEDSLNETFTEGLSSFSASTASVLFVGPVFGKMKDQLLRSASAFILPSFSEGLPMSVLEAWSYGLPVLMTEHCNLPEGFANNAAIRIGTESNSIAEGLIEMQQCQAQELLSMGRSGRVLVERGFTWPQVASGMKKVYEWILGGGPRPSCVEA